ncbi:hypothetical protein SPONN_1612 [uncultured Candidatus Thioglobus sp.]|nr:hypothetical protein SPONN_1612 [uncultured Candidatus Thioglobus sp.]SMN00956.1 hypothetical protein SPONL_1628 [uncultured Candidatus Thioglobus sp.]
MSLTLNDKTTRMEIEQDPIAFAKKNGYIVGEDTKVTVVKNTKTTTYFVLNKIQEADDLLEDLGNLNAAGVRSTVGTLLTCLSSLSSK